jgi:hypothetical protein
MISESTSDNPVGKTSSPEPRPQSSWGSLLRVQKAHKVPRRSKESVLELVPQGKTLLI